MRPPHSIVFFFFVFLFFCFLARACVCMCICICLLQMCVQSPEAIGEVVQINVKDVTLEGVGAPVEAKFPKNGKYYAAHIVRIYDAPVEDAPPAKSKSSDGSASGESPTAETADTDPDTDTSSAQAGKADETTTTSVADPADTATKAEASPSESADAATTDATGSTEEQVSEPGSVPPTSSGNKAANEPEPEAVPALTYFGDGKPRMCEVCVGWRDACLLTMHDSERLSRSNSTPNERCIMWYLCVVLQIKWSDGDTRFRHMPYSPANLRFTATYPHEHWLFGKIVNLKHLPVAISNESVNDADADADTNADDASETSGSPTKPKTEVCATVQICDYPDTVLDAIPVADATRIRVRKPEVRSRAVLCLFVVDCRLQSTRNGFASCIGVLPSRAALYVLHFV